MNISSNIRSASSDMNASELNASESNASESNASQLNAPESNAPESHAADRAAQGAVRSDTSLAPPPSWWAPRLRAAGLHFLLSLIVVAGSTTLLLTQWYPGPFIHAAGGVKLLAMIAAIDLILGPLLTLIVFDRRKKSLPFDLAVIVALQAGALGYGLFASHEGRPAYQVFAIDRIELLSAAEIDADEYKLLDPRLKQHDRKGPMLVAARPPTDAQARNELALAAASGVDLKMFLRYYVDYDSQREQILAAALPIAKLEQFNPPQRVQAELSSLPPSLRSVANLRYLPVQGKREDLTMIVDPVSARPIALLRLSPWKS